MAGIIGPASEFYRLRLTRIDAGGDVEFDWRDDVLWRHRPATLADESDVWLLQAVSLDEDEAVAAIAAFQDRDAADAALAEAAEDLETMTRSDFDAEYLRGPASDTTANAEDTA